jgi:hypothetical protein
MQETVAMAKIEGMTKAYRQQHPDQLFPIMHTFFGDTPGSNLHNEIAIFSEQCHQAQASAGPVLTA